MKNALFAEEKKLAVQTLANISNTTTNFVDLKKGFRVAFVIALPTTVDAATVKVTLQQRKGTGPAKDLAVNNSYFYQTATDLEMVRNFIDLENEQSEFDLSTQFATAGGIAVFEVLAEDLDVNNDYDQVALKFATSTNAKGATIMTVVEPKHLPAYKA